MELTKVRKFFFIFVLMGCSTATKMPYFCHKNFKLNAKLNVTHAKNPEVFLQTGRFEALLKKGETWCFDLMVEGDGKLKSGRRFFISLRDIKQEYTVKSSYNFSIPTVDVECLCDCSSSEELVGRCISRRCQYENSYNKNGECSHTYRRNEGNKKCASSGQSHVCCFVSIHKDGLSPDFTAISFTEPKLNYTIEFGFADDQEELIGIMHTRQILFTYSITVEHIGRFWVTTDSSNKSFLPYGKWYFKRLFNTSLLTGEHINEINKANLTKLGWYKYTNYKRLVPLDWTSLNNSFTYVVTDCSNDKISWKLNASFYNRTDSLLRAEGLGVPVKDLNNKILHVRDGDTKVITEMPSTVNVTLNNFINVSAREVFSYPKSTLRKFIAEINVDSLENRNLLLNLSGASGHLTVSVELTNAEMEDFSMMVLSTEPINTSKTIPLFAHYKCPVKVCINNKLHAINQCKTASCEKLGKTHVVKDTRAQTFLSQLYHDVHGHWHLLLHMSGHAAFGSFVVSLDKRDSERESFSSPGFNRTGNGVKLLPLHSSYICPNMVCISSNRQNFHQCLQAPCAEEKIDDNRHPALVFILSFPTNIISGAIALFCLILISVCICCIRRRGACMKYKKKRIKSIEPILLGQSTSLACNRASSISNTSASTHRYSELDYTVVKRYQLSAEYSTTLHLEPPSTIPPRVTPRQKIDCQETIILQHEDHVPKSEAVSDGYLKPNQDPRKEYIELKG